MLFGFQSSTCTPLQRGCGLHNGGCAALCDALKGHRGLAFLDVGENPISDGGAAALLDLIKSNPRLKEVMFDGYGPTGG